MGSKDQLEQSGWAAEKRESKEELEQRGGQTERKGKEQTDRLGSREDGRHDISCSRRGDMKLC